MGVATGVAAAGQLAQLAELVGGLAVAVYDDGAARQSLVARDAFARLARLVGAQRVVLQRLVGGSDRTLVTQEWAAAGVPALPEASGSADRWPWPADELARGEVLEDRGAVARSAAMAAVVAVPVVLDGAVDSVLSVHWQDAPTDWSPALAPLLRTVAVLVRGAERLVELAERPSLDELTGLANRKLLLVALGRSLARLERRASGGVAVLACQVAGPPDSPADAALVRHVGRRLERTIREGDLVAVFDHRTLVVVCDDVAGPAEALAIGQRLSATVLEGEPAGGRGGDPGFGGLPSGNRASFGVAHAVTRVPPGVVLRQADAAAYLAAESGDAVRLAGG